MRVLLLGVSRQRSVHVQGPVQFVGWVDQLGLQLGHDPAVLLLLAMGVWVDQRALLACVLGGLDLSELVHGVDRGIAIGDVLVQAVLETSLALNFFLKVDWRSLSCRREVEHVVADVDLRVLLRHFNAVLHLAR